MRTEPKRIAMQPSSTECLPKEKRAQKDMATTAEKYGFGARAPYAEPRASEHDMKERVRLSGRFPRVNDEPLSKTLSALVKEFEKSAALGAVLE